MVCPQWKAVKELLLEAMSVSQLTNCLILVLRCFETPFGSTKQGKLRKLYPFLHYLLCFIKPD